MEIEMLFARHDKDGRFQFTQEEHDGLEMDEEEAAAEVNGGRPMTGKQAREAR